jgi:hypothetical protein
MAAKKSKSSAASSAVAVDQPTAEGAAPAAGADVAGRFVGQWNRLVSTTNWEKGRIICQWREALELAGAPVTEYSDEAWAQLVGNVTSQHVGRLRRVFQRFGAVFDQYEGLYWSHFQAGLDWDDAEMWLEGAILNAWSVSQMRGKRWETLGNVGDPPEDLASTAPFDDDATSEHKAGDGIAAPPAAPTDAALAAPRKQRADESMSDEADDTNSHAAADHDDSYEAPASQKSPAKSRSRLNVEVGDLPDDIADAFEQFKLAIIAQRRLGWSETSPATVIECLDALRELALAPADD